MTCKHLAAASIDCMFISNGAHLKLDTGPAGGGGGVGQGGFKSPILIDKGRHHHLKLQARASFILLFYFTLFSPQG